MGTHLYSGMGTHLYSGMGTHLYSEPGSGAEECPRCLALEPRNVPDA